MTITPQAPPPPEESPPMGWGRWTELVAVCDPVEADYLLGRLSSGGIATGVLESEGSAHGTHCRRPKDGVAVICVQVAHLEDARFALAWAAYDAPPARHAPFAEKGVRHYLVSFSWIPALMLSLALIFVALILDDRSGRGCEPAIGAAAWRAGRTLVTTCNPDDSPAEPREPVSDRTGERVRTTPPRTGPAAL